MRQPTATTTAVPPDPRLIDASDRVIAALGDALRIGGGRGGGAREPFAVRDPGTNEVIATVADAGAEDARRAVDEAYRAGLAWARTTPRHRADVLRAAYDLVIDRAEDFALLITREMGKPLAESRAELTYAADFVRWYAEEAVRPGGGYRPSPNGDGRLITGRSPVGVCLLITPWNFPLAMATRKVAPALAAGCSVILKPAALTPLSSLLFADVLREAGVPDGVVNVVTTTDAGSLSATAMADRRVRKVSFTGSTPVGMSLAESAAKSLMRTSMELGGNAAFVVLDDADLDRAVEQALVAKLRNGGQSCIAANRYLVHSGIADSFVDAFAERMSAVGVGHGLGADVALGPVIDERALSSLAHLVDGALDEGAELRVGGTAIAGDGFYFPPTLLDRVPASAAISATEIFGPVATITRFDTDDDAIRLANDTPFGLAGYLFSQDIDRALALADRMQTGMVGINKGVVSNVAAPFGGVKLSGLGREGGAEGLEEYQDVRMYNIAGR